MKIRIENYTFVAAAGTVEFDDYAGISLDGVLIIVNVTDGIIIYNFADPAKGGTVATNVLTLEHDTTGMANGDDLLIYYDDAAVVTALTDAELRATPVPVSGTITANAGANLNTSALATQATLAALLAKVIAAPSTEAKQDAANALLTTIAGLDFASEETLADVLASVDAVFGAVDGLEAKDYATQATLALIKAKTDNLDVALSTLGTQTTLAAILAKIIAAPATEATLASILAAVDGLEALVAALTTPADTQPISAAALPLPALAATSTKQSDGSQKTQIVDGAGNVIGATANALDVHIASGASSGTEYTEGDTDASITGTALLWEDAANTLRAASAAKPLPVEIIAGGGSGGLTDTELRATPVPVSGTVTANAGTNLNTSALALESGGVLDDAVTFLTAIDLKLDGLATGAETQPVSLATVPSHPVTNAGTFATQVDGAALTALELIDNIVSGAGVNISQINGVAPLMGAGNTGTGSPRVTLATDQAQLTNPLLTTPGGNVAHDAADSGNPLKIGGIARQANPAAVTALDRTDAMFDDVGRQVVVLGHVRDLVSQQYTQIVNSTTETTVVTAGGAGVFNDITAIVISKSAAVGVTIKDSTGGTTRMVLGGAATVPLVLTVPLPQTAGANNNWTVTLSNNTTTVDITVQFVKNV